MYSRFFGVIVEGSMPRQAFRWTNPPENFRASGPEVLRAYFFPRQILQIQEAARIIGICREALYKRQWRGQNSLKISKHPGTGRQFIILDDLIAFLYPQKTDKKIDLPATSSVNYRNGVMAEKKKRGRPRGSKNKAKKESAK